VHRLEGPHSDALQLCTSGPGPKRSMQSAIVCESAVREKSGHISRLFWAWYFGLRMRHVIFMDAPPFFIPLVVMALSDAFSKLVCHVCAVAEMPRNRRSAVNRRLSRLQRFAESHSAECDAVKLA